MEKLSENEIYHILLWLSDEIDIEMGINREPIEGVLDFEKMLRKLQEHLKSLIKEKK